MKNIINPSIIVILIILSLYYFIGPAILQFCNWYASLCDLNKWILGLSSMVYFFVGINVITWIIALNNPEQGQGKFTGQIWTGEGFVSQDQAIRTKEIHFKILVITLLVDLFFVIIFK